MYRRLLERPEPDFLSLISNCCRDNSDQVFQIFRTLWHPYLEAALARFIKDWDLAASVCDATYFDYRETFKRRYDPFFDYRTYFIAIAYAHLIRLSGSQGLTILLQRLGFILEEQGEDVLVLCAILRLSPKCAYDLLSQCFDPVPTSLRLPAVVFCVLRLREVLRTIAWR